MSIFDQDEEDARTFAGYNLRVIPFERLMWATFGNGDPPEAAHVIALAVPAPFFLGPAEIDYRTVQPKHSPRAYKRRDVSTDDALHEAMDGENEWLATWVLIAEDWESPWLKLGENVFFTEKGAVAQAAEEQRRMKERAAAEANTEPPEA